MAKFVPRTDYTLPLITSFSFPTGRPVSVLITVRRTSCGHSQLYPALCRNGKLTQLILGGTSSVLAFFVGCSSATTTSGAGRLLNMVSMVRCFLNMVNGLFLRCSFFCSFGTLTDNSYAKTDACPAVGRASSCRPGTRYTVHGLKRVQRYSLAASCRVDGYIRSQLL